jgi:hypothetical protein
MVKIERLLNAKDIDCHGICPVCSGGFSTIDTFLRHKKCTGRQLSDLKAAVRRRVNYKFQRATCETTVAEKRQHSPEPELPSKKPAQPHLPLPQVRAEPFQQVIEKRQHSPEPELPSKKPAQPHLPLPQVRAESFQQVIEKRQHSPEPELPSKKPAQPHPPSPQVYAEPSQDSFINVSRSFTVTSNAVHPADGGYINDLQGDLFNTLEHDNLLISMSSLGDGSYFAFNNLDPLETDYSDVGAFFTMA